MKLRGLFVALLALSAVWARDWPAMRDEADKGLPPWIQYYDRLKGEPRLGPLDQHLSEPESLNVKLVGKWGRGPAARVTGRDTLVYLALGSEVAAFNCVNAHTPVIVNEIQCRYVVDRPILEDSILYCVLQGGVEVFNIANPASPTRIKYLPISAVDMCINDTMAYTIDADSFKAYRIVAPDSFQRLGACADSGYYIAADSGFAYLCDRWGLYVIDATDPADPHQVSVVTDAQTGAALVDSGYCYYTTCSASPNSFRIADVSDPYHPTEVGYIDSVASYELCKLSHFVYLSTYCIVDVSTPSFPTTVGSASYGGNGVWTRSPFSYSFLAADYNGFATININDPVHPALDTVLAGASDAEDMSLVQNLACVADFFAGMKVLSVVSPSSPTEIGCYDTVGESPTVDAVAARDSFAFAMMGLTYYLTAFRVIDISNPARPALIATDSTWNPGRAVVLRDTLTYVAEDHHFEVFSVANPRNPRLLGGCQLPNSSYGLCLRDSLAFVGNLTSLQIINVANPVSPRVIGHLTTDALGVAVEDTIAIVGGVSQLFAISVANPAAPRLISTLTLEETCYGISMAGTTAYVGASANSSSLRVFDISNPESLRCTGYYVAPGEVIRTLLQDSLVYAACLGGGVCIFETTSTNAIGEAGPVAATPQAFALTPNPASSFVDVRLEVKQNTDARNTVKFFNADGRVVLRVPYVADRGQQPRSQRVDISTLPDGCYFVAVEQSGQDRVQKVVKTGKRR